jgi:phosphohistidine phosphatase
MLLHLVRHAQAENQTRLINDFDRQLTLFGQNQVVKLTAHLSKLNLTNTRIYVSTAKRTCETSIGILNKNKHVFVSYEAGLYNASTESILKFINQLASNQDILIIGHNEGISALASYLCNQYIGLDTACAVTISFECNNSIGIAGETGYLVDFFNPLLDQ